MKKHKVVIELEVTTPMSPVLLANFYLGIVSELEGTEHITGAVSVNVGGAFLAVTG